MIRIKESKIETLKSETSKCGDLKVEKRIYFLGILVHHHSYFNSATLIQEESKGFGFNRNEK